MNLDIVAFFTILRPNELVNLNKHSVINEKDGALLCTRLKQLMTSL
jgi:hypothetical protein